MHFGQQPAHPKGHASTGSPDDRALPDGRPCLRSPAGALVRTGPSSFLSEVHVMLARVLYGWCTEA